MDSSLTSNDSDGPCEEGSPATHLARVGSLDTLSGQRLGLGGARVPLLGEALP